LGTPGAPVRIGPNTNDNARAQANADPALVASNTVSWGGIAFDRADHVGLLSNVVVRGATSAGADPVKMIAAVSSSRTSLFLYGLDIDDSRLPLIMWDSDWAVLNGCRLRITVVGDAFKITRVAHTRIENCDMYCGLDIIDTDAIDFGEIPGDCIVRNNHFHDFVGSNNDGLDLGEGCTDILLEDNLIERCVDKGISCGGGSTVTVRRNVIRNVDMGIGLKDAGSHAFVDNTTFYNLAHAVSAYEKVLGRGGASATVRNSIVSQASVSPFYTDALSAIDATYTLSDTDAIPGDGNAVGDPLFLNPAADNLALQTGSPAIDSGSPDSAADPDGSRADMGACAFDWREGHAVISEIFYHPVVAGQAEYVELTNPGGAPLDLTGYSFGKGFSYAFPAGTTLNPNAYLVVASGSNTPNGAPALIWTSGSLDNAGETIQLLDAASNEIDRVAYKPTAPWPVEADGGGSSLALIHPRWNNALPSSWCASALPGGTPGGAELAAHNTPVWWLAQWGTSNRFDEAATNDWDHDGAPNWAEFVAGTHPTNAASVLRIELQPTGDGRFEIGCATLPTGSEYGGQQRYYTLESRTNLLNGAWSAVEGFSNILGTGQPLVYTNRPVATEFLRVRADLR